MVSGFLIRTVLPRVIRVSRRSGRLVLMGCRLMRIRVGRGVDVLSVSNSEERFSPRYVELK